MKNTSLNLGDSKPHYDILDGFRGVAALFVLFYHIFEGHANGSTVDQVINHGYLAVDFFFFLSGYVVSYAYDDRWNKMTVKDFFKRRLIRLQPMIIIGSIVGGLLFYFQHSPNMSWGGIADTPIWLLMLVTLFGCALIPILKGGLLEIRGWGEMYPLNGPAWSLFFEYLANIIYGLFLRRVTKTVLSILVIVAAGFSIHYIITNPSGDICGGWELSLHHLYVGFIRLAFPFLAGMLLAKIGKLRYTKNAFLIGGILLAVLFATPRLGGHEHFWMNRIYESFCLFIMFPLIVWMGAGGKVTGKKATKLCKFLGDISYPLYITHYPIVYTYMAWVANNNYTIKDSWPGALLVIACAIPVAYFSMKLYDIPVRKWLRKKFL